VLVVRPDRGGDEDCAQTASGTTGQKTSGPERIAGTPQIVEMISASSHHRATRRFW
jgi:hypothetical protein